MELAVLWIKIGIAVSAAYFSHPVGVDLMIQAIDKTERECRAAGTQPPSINMSAAMALLGSVALWPLNFFALALALSGYRVKR